MPVKFGVGESQDSEMPSVLLLDCVLYQMKMKMAMKDTGLGEVLLDEANGETQT